MGNSDGQLQFEPRFLTRFVYSRRARFSGRRRCSGELLLRRLPIRLPISTDVEAAGGLCRPPDQAFLLSPCPSLLRIFLAAPAIGRGRAISSPLRLRILRREGTQVEPDSGAAVTCQEGSRRQRPATHPIRE